MPEEKHRHTLTLEQFEELAMEDGGLCTSCGAEAYGVEPDARNYRCEECGEYAVFGAEEMLVMGLVS